MQNYIEISCNFYSKRKKIFEHFLHNFRAKKIDWKPYTLYIINYLSL